MSTSDGIDAQLTSAGSALASILRDVDTTEPADWANEAESLRRLYTGILSESPMDLTAAVGIAVLDSTRLRAHLSSQDNGYGWWEDDSVPAPSIAAGDVLGRQLINESIRSGRRVRDLDPTNNLAAYAEGLAHECDGSHPDALAAYRRALELDQWDQFAAERAQVLGHDHVPDRAAPTPNPHSRRFWLVRAGQLVSHSGDEEVIYWRFSDPARIPDAVESIQDDVEIRSPGLASVTLHTFVPGFPPIEFDLYEAVSDLSAERLEIDLSVVDLEVGSEEPRLPQGQAVRVNGYILCDGDYGPVEE